jgi:hypothetical protein
MHFRTKHLLLSLVGGGLGVLLLVMGLRSATSLVLADDATFAASSDSGVIQIDTLPEDAAELVSDWQTVLLDVYDGTYTDTYSIARTISAEDGSSYQWGRTVAGSPGLTDALWCVQGGAGTSLQAGMDTYTDGITTTVTYGPINFTYVVTAALQFSHWISVADGDGLAWGYSTDGASYTFVDVQPTAMGVWETTSANSVQSADLAQLVGQPKVYLAFRFTSNDDGQVDLGVLLDNVRLWARTHAQAYLPLVVGEPDIYVDDFSDVTSGWPRAWRVKTKNINIYGGYMVERTSERLWADLTAEPGALPLDPGAKARFLGQGDEVYYSVVHDAWDLVFVSGPEQFQGDFSFEARARYDYARKQYKGNRYGILLTREPVHPVEPDDVRGYSFYVEINPSSSGGFHKAGWGLIEWFNIKDDDTIKGPHDSGVIHSGLGDWNTMRVERRGSTLYLYINDVDFGSVDGIYSGPMYVGLFARHTGSGSTELSYDMLFEWDDVVVTPLD